MTKYIPLEAVFNYIPKGVKEEEGDDSQLLSWALQALRHTNIVQRYERRICILTVKNHKAELPEEIRNINRAMYMTCEPTEQDSEDLCGCLSFDDTCFFDETDLTPQDSPTSTEAICRLPINYRLALNSNFIKNNFTKMKYVGNYTKICKQCKNDFCNNCVYTYSVDKNLVLTCSSKDGWICLDYDAEIKDDNDNFLIPDDVDLMRGISYYVQSMHWLNRDSRKEQGAFQRYQTFLNQAEMMLTKAKGKFKLKAIDKQLIWAITNSAHRFLRAPSVWAQSRLNFNEHG